MVNSDKGITNLHVPSDVIVDASMPAMIRTSGHMWGPDGEEADTLAVIPDSSYAAIYQAVIDDCRANGAFDPTTMGSVPERRADGPEGRGVRQPRQDLRDRPRPGRSRSSTPPARCSWSTTSRPATSGGPARPRTPRSATGSSWPSPAPGPAARRRSSGSTSSRAHDRNLIAKVARPTCRTTTPRASTCSVLTPVDAMATSVERIRRGEDTISVTGNVLRDYNTDLFPILELGTSAKMLSVVPLMNGGGLFETGAGGSAPKHVQQLVQENYLRWDSLGEFMALAESFRHLAESTGNTGAGHARRDPRPRHRAAAQGEQVPEPSGRRDRQPRQPRLPRVRAGRRSSPSRPATPSWPPCSARSRRRWRPTSRRSSRTSSTCRASRWTSAATTGRTRRRPTP